MEAAVPPAVPEGIVLCYGGFYGPGASELLLDLVRKRKARKELGWEPRYASWREGFRAWVGG